MSGQRLILLALVLTIRPGVTLDAGPFHLDTKLLFTVAVAPLAGMGLAGVWSAILTVFSERLFGYEVAVAALALYVLWGSVLIPPVPDVRPSAWNFVRPDP